SLVTLGLNDTFLRFATPIASLIALHRLVARPSPGRPAPTLLIALAAFLAPCVNFALSPEMGIATWLGCLAYFVHLWWTPLRRLTLCLIAVIAALPAVRLLFSPSYFDSIFSFSGGGGNFPIFPTANILMFLIALFSVVPFLATIAMGSREVSGSIAIALCMTLGLL